VREGGTPSKSARHVGLEERRPRVPKRLEVGVQPELTLRDGTVVAPLDRPATVDLVPSVVEARLEGIANGPATRGDLAFVSARSGPARAPLGEAGEDAREQDEQPGDREPERVA